MAQVIMSSEGRYEVRSKSVHLFVYFLAVYSLPREGICNSKLDSAFPSHTLGGAVGLLLFAMFMPSLKRVEVFTPVRVAR